MSDYGWIPPTHCVGTHRWVPSSGGHVPSDAVVAGMDKDGGQIFVGRAFHEGDLLPAKVCPTHGCAFVAYSGEEVTKIHYEVLCSEHVAWKFARNGDYPPEAIRVGTTSGGEPLFVGRTMIEGTLTPGKVHPSHNCLYIPFAGKEISVPEYEILILN
uniref:Uncharacterized protein n=1 Tax=Riptortus pedestris TaxID=329032 RepID=R4WCK1_RIPPE|nr:conserved hypothetical protein [Riptortus pedestris]